MSATETMPELPEPEVAPETDPMIFHAEGWCDGPGCQDPHHAWVRRNAQRASNVPQRGENEVEEGL